MEDPIAKILKLLRSCIEGRFFGTLTISFQSGKVGNVKIEQTKKIEEL